MSDRRRWHIKDPATQERILANLRKYQGQAGPRRWRGKLPIPKTCHSLVRKLFEVMNDRKISLGDMASWIETDYAVISRWRNHHPSLKLLERAFHVLGYELVARGRIN